jgi:hypothetical protein
LKRLWRVGIAGDPVEGNACPASLHPRDLAPVRTAV